jgi:hypothetical protein
MPRSTYFAFFVGMLLCTCVINEVKALEYKELLGAWVGEANAERLEFRRGGDVFDARMGQARFSTNVISEAANMALVYQGNRWCYYHGEVSEDGRTLFLAWRRQQDPWICTAGRFTKVRQ